MAAALSVSAWPLARWPGACPGVRTSGQASALQRGFPASPDAAARAGRGRRDWAGLCEVFESPSARAGPDFLFLQRHRLAFGGVLNNTDEHARKSDVRVEPALLRLVHETLPIVFPQGSHDVGKLDRQVFAQFVVQGNSPNKRDRWCFPFIVTLRAGKREEYFGAALGGTPRKRSGATGTEFALFGGGRLVE